MYAWEFWCNYRGFILTLLSKFKLIIVKIRVEAFAIKLCGEMWIQASKHIQSRANIASKSLRWSQTVHNPQNEVPNLRESQEKHSPPNCNNAAIRRGEIFVFLPSFIPFTTGHYWGTQYFSSFLT